MRRTVGGLLPVLGLVWLGSLPALAQQTLEIPREQLEALPDAQELTRPQITPPDGSLEGLFRSLEDAARTDWTGSLPEAVTEQLPNLGTPFERQIEVVWEMRVSGSWSETLSGRGSLTVLDRSELGGPAGRQLSAVLDSAARDWPFGLTAFLPEGARKGRWFGFSGGGDGQGTGFGAATNHLFERARTLGHATPQGMRAQAPSDASMTDEYLYTEVQGGRVRVDSENAYRMHFRADVEEFRRGGEEIREATGRLARISGWVCEAAAYAADPDNCLFDDFQVVDHTPTRGRGNVNRNEPSITVTFSDPVDLDSLAEHFTLFTQDAQGRRVEVEGTWQEADYVGAWHDEARKRAEAAAPLFDDFVCTADNSAAVASHSFPDLQDYADPREYAFRPDRPLRAGTRYEARIEGGEEGVQARHGNDIHLEETFVWQFSTLLVIEEQPPEEEGREDALELSVYQPVRDPLLVTDKPALSRLYPNWSLHEDIHEHWQPEGYEMEIALAEDHPLVPRVVAQHGTEARRLAPRNHVVRLLSEARSFPPDESLSHPGHTEARRKARHTVNFFGWEPRRGGPDVLAFDLCPHDPFPHALASAVTSRETAIELWDHDPGDLTIHVVRAAVGDWADEVPQIDDNLITRTLRKTAEVVPQFLPYRSARIVSLRDQDFSFRTFLTSSAIAQDRAGAQVRELQSRLRSQLDPDSVLVVLLPGGVIDVDGFAYTELASVRNHGARDYRTRVVFLSVPGAQERMRRTAGANAENPPAGFVHDSVTDDTLAQALLHEIAHALSLRHNPTDWACAPDPIGRYEEGIEGFRLDPSGLHGWNKSVSEGNGEVGEGILRHDLLLSHMWPYPIPNAGAMLTMDEYAAVQQDIERGFSLSSPRQEGPGCPG